MKQKTKTIEIDWDGKKEKVVLKKLNYGEYLKILKKGIPVNLTTKTAKLDIEELYLHLLLYSIVTAPFSITEKGIKELEPELAEYILTEAIKLNPVMKNVVSG